MSRTPVCPVRRSGGPHITLPSELLDLPGRIASSTVLEARSIAKQYRKESVKIPVLTDASIQVRGGEFVAIVGQSGSGKSTFLHLLGTLDAPDKGEILFRGDRIDNLSARRRDVIRNRNFGMVFQFYHLLPELNTLENVLTPLMIRESVLQYHWNRRQHREEAVEMLRTVGLEHRLKHKPRELSGGEMQRAAIARALITRPDLLLADEPTGNLDRDSGSEVMDLLIRLNRDHNLTIVMVTHDLTVAAKADRVVRLVDGSIQPDA